MSYGNPNRHEDNEDLSREAELDPNTEVVLACAFVHSTKEMHRAHEQNRILRAQNAELLAALRDMVGSHGLVQRAICVAGEKDPSVAMREARALIARIEATP